MPKRNLPYRTSIRLKGWDYRNPGLYFVTICTQDRRHHFGEIKNGIMGLSVPGCIAWHYWRQIPDHQSNVILDQFVVMPNHLHGIIGIESIEKKSGGTCHGNSDKESVGLWGHAMACPYEILPMKKRKPNLASPNPNHYQ
ncbi:MAG: transposase [Balneolaceae bacterium]|nr:transposase [Balneolaceae bacterium]